MTEVVEQAKADGYVETLYHRRRALPELKSSNFNMRSFGERLKAEGLEARLVLQVHDELIVECPQAEAEQVQRLLTEEMEGVAHLAVPLTAEAHWGKNWLEAKG